MIAATRTTTSLISISFYKSSIVFYFRSPINRLVSSFFIFSSENGTRNGTPTPRFLFSSFHSFFLEIEMTGERFRQMDEILPTATHFFFYPIPVDLIGGVDHTICNVTHEEASRIIILP